MDNAVDFLRSSPAYNSTATAVLAGVLTLLSAASWMSPKASEVLALIPGDTVPNVWNIVTASFVAPGPVGLLVNLAGILLVVPKVEVAYGHVSVLSLAAVSAAAAGLFSFLVYFVLFFFTRQGVQLFTPRSGFYGVLGGLIVAFSQLPTLDPIVVLGTKLPTYAMPAAYVAVCLLGSGFQAAGIEWTFVLGGTAASWLYLRRIQAFGGEGGQLTSSNVWEVFADARMSLQSMGTQVAAQLGAPVKLSPRPGASGQTEVPNGGAPVPPPRSREAARRIELGQKALDDRIRKMEAGTANGADAPTLPVSDTEPRLPSNS